jgi:UDP-N-acetylmuramyl pentapeptide phosphotransferase/UDP-N-acetylglucosamine-1-phosphate transferase
MICDAVNHHRMESVCRQDSFSTKRTQFRSPCYGVPNSLFSGKKFPVSNEAALQDCLEQTIDLSFHFWFLGKADRMNLSVILAVSGISALLSYAIMIAIHPFLRRYALARPNARSSHKEPTPQGGGLAVIAATIVAASVAVLWASMPAGNLAAIFAATVLITAVGMIDDIWTTPVIPRLAAQAAAIAIVVAALPHDLRVVQWLPWWPERILLLIGALWFVNLVNFMDGIDWMTVAEIVPVSAGLALLGVMGALPSDAIVVSLALLGAILGFAPFNKPVARLFLGDVGSLPIGLILGWLLLLLASGGHIAAALLLPLYYLADATITLIRRALNSERVWQAHRSHFYQRATDRGVPVIRIVTQVFAVNVVLVALAAASVWFATTAAALLTLTTGVIVVSILLFNFSRATP